MLDLDWLAYVRKDYEPIHEYHLMALQRKGCGFHKVVFAGKNLIGET